MSSNKRVLITAGGTGGHLYPAQGLAQQLLKQSASCEVLFVGGGLASNRYFDHGRYPYQEVKTSSLTLTNPIKLMKGCGRIIQGIRQSVAILKKFRPDVVVGFGSYFTIPPILAARWLNIPIILHEANSIPGQANKWLAPLATMVGVQFPSAASLFKRKTIEVNLPLREGYQMESVNKKEALAYFTLSDQKQTLLICGGSQGAQAINRLIPECFPVMRQLALQVIHFTGDVVTANRLHALYSENGIPACVKAFEPHMQMAWRAATAFVGRSGASTVVEALEFEVPGILIPYPYATDNHQEKNADFLVHDVKAAWKFSESELSAKKLSEKLACLYESDQLFIFKEALKNYKLRPGRTTLCELILNLIS